MPWQLTSDVAEFDRHTHDLLHADPVGNTLALTILDWLLAGRTYSSSEPVFAWYASTSGAVSGAALMTPPYELQLFVLPDDTVTELVALLRDQGVELPGVRISTPSGEAFAAAWAEQHGLTARTTLRLRLHALGELTPPDPRPSGTPRQATSADLDVAIQWWDEFQAEAESHRIDPSAAASASVADGLLTLWTDDDGRPVSMAASKRPVDGAARLGPVYTPPENRGRGYGGAVTAACAAGALEAGATHVLLFTDLANPVSNHIYRRIGFRPVSDSRAITFVPSDLPAAQQAYTSSP